MYNVYPIHVSTRLFDVTYLNTENYIGISQTARLKKKKEEDQPTDNPNFQAKRANKPLLLKA